MDGIILAWQAASPISFGAVAGMLVGAGLVGALWLECEHRRQADERRHAERAARRAETKANGGL